MKGEKLWQYPLAFVGRAVYPVGVEGMGEIIFLARYRVYFITWKSGVRSK